MKILSTIFFIILAGLIVLTQTSLSQRCIEYSEPLYRGETRMIDCPLVKKSLHKRSSDDMFIVDLTECSIVENTKKLCDKVKNVFITAGKYITATLNLKSTIRVNARFFDFCKQKDNQNCKNRLGTAAPSRFIPHQDPTDQKTRIYPQALYKQLNLPGDVHPVFAQYEILARINSNSYKSYWFEGDPLPMPSDKVDLLHVVVHELTHGLGFANLWDDYLNIKVLTPGKRENISMETPFNIKLQNQFTESVFDRSLVLLPSGTSLTSLADQLNQFQISSTASDQEFISTFTASPQFQIASDLYKNATINGTIGFLTTPNVPPNTQLTPEQIQNDVVILETSGPFVSASSIGHVDRRYSSTRDFLMISQYSSEGETLDQIMSRVGSTNTTGPMGPKLRSILGTLGYEVKQDYIPPSINNNSSLISVNLTLFLVCILLTLINDFSF